MDPAQKIIRFAHLTTARFNTSQLHRKPRSNAAHELIISYALHKLPPSSSLTIDLARPSLSYRPTSMNKPTMIDSRRNRRGDASPPIPFPQTHLRRTTSEVALEEANRLAEWRENQMYHRLLTGMMRRSKEKGLDQHPKIIRSLENLMQTHASPISSLEPSSKQNEEWDVITCSCSTDENQGIGMGLTRNSGGSHGSLSRHSSPASSWSSAMNGWSSSSSLSRRPSRARLTLAPLKESLKSSFKIEEGIFDLEL